MLGLLGLAAIILLLFVVIFNKLSPIVALIVIPIVAALLAGYTTEIAGFITEGIKTISSTAVMFVFAILFFGILTDVGTFDPIISKLLGFAGNDPGRIGVATAILAMLVHLDGSGAVTFLVTIPAMLPIYDKVGMKRTTLATIVALAAGTMNILPWGGPTIRAGVALNIPVMELFSPLVIPVIAGLLTVIGIAYWLGIKERKSVLTFLESDDILQNKPSNNKTLKARLMWYFNLLLIVLTISAIISEIAPPHVVFMVAFSIAISINYPSISKQRERVDAHAKAALLMASILFSAGCFIGIMQGSGMIQAIVTSGLEYIPPIIGNNLVLITGLSSMPASLLFDPDSFYFGVLPILASTAESFNGNAIDIGRAAIIGQMTTGFPVSPLTGSTFLLIGLAGIDLGEHQRKTIPLAFFVTLVILSVSILIGAITI